MKVTSDIIVPSHLFDKTIVGIDPSSRNTGIAAVDQKGRLIHYCLVKARNDTLGGNIDEILDGLSVINGLDPIVFLEQPSFFIRGGERRNTTSAMKLLAAVFSIYGALKAKGYPVFLLPVERWKGKARKEDNLKRVNLKFFQVASRSMWMITNDNIADAIGIADWGYNFVKVMKRRI